MKFSPWGLFPDNKKPPGHTPYWLQDRDPETEQKHLDTMKKVEHATRKLGKKASKPS